jgi:murein DD-endopeptidase MepM/ murein hydrolase activator NlpD
VIAPLKEGPYFVWPARGEVISCFGSKFDRSKNKGVDIRVDEGTDIRASKSGRVVFCDEKFKGFGKTVIIDHGSRYQTVYAYNSIILVKVGDEVSQNTVIARSGSTGRAKEPSLHFEIRKDGRPEDPLSYLR